MPQRGAGSPSPGRRAPTEGNRRRAEIAQLEAERERAAAEAAWLAEQSASEPVSRAKVAAEAAALEAEGVAHRAAAENALAEIPCLEARAELHRLEAEEKRRELAEDDADAHFARTYTFHDDVTRESVAECVAALSHWNRRFPGQPVTLQFCTGGGSTFDAFALFGIVRGLVASGTEVTTVGLGLVASAGSLLLQSGSTRVMDRDAWMMIHAPATADLEGWATTFQVEDEAALLRQIWNQLVGIYAERSGMEPDEIRRRAERRDWYMLADEVLRLGLCDEVR